MAISGFGAAGQHEGPVLQGDLHADQWHEVTANRRAAMSACSAPASIEAGSIWLDRDGANPHFDTS